MAKVKIDMKTGVVESPTTNIIIGIDLGTTNSIVAFRKDGETVAIKNEQGSSSLVPSVVYFKDNGQIVVGESAKEMLTLDPTNTIFSVKRLMGKSYQDIVGYSDFFSYKIIDSEDDSLVKIQVGDKFHSPVTLSAEILKNLKKRIEKELNQKVNKAVITVPAYFNDVQRQSTRDAGKLAGLDVLRIINEPTAASLAYGIGLDKSKDEKVVVFDLGGGTFDVSILNIEHGVFEVLSTNGNTWLGGDDFDRKILEYWFTIHPSLAQKAKADQKTLQRLRLIAEQAKINLSFADSFSYEFDKFNLEIAISKFEELIAPQVSETLKCVSEAMKDSGLKISDIDQIILVGGSTRIPVIRKSLENVFNKAPNSDIDPDEVVALGAAIQANILAGENKDILLLDVNPLSLGIETVGGLMDVIISRNSTIPCQVKRKYTTSIDGQKNLRVSVFQGERDLVDDNRKLGEFILSDIPPMAAGIPKIEISFIIDADGILRVTAKELRSQTFQEISINNQYGISEEEMAKMLIDSIKEAENDMIVRALKEAQIEGSLVSKSVSKFIFQNDRILTDQQVDEIKSLDRALQQSVEKGSKDEINLNIEKLNEYTKPLAQQAMDFHIKDAIRGKKIL